MGEYFDDAHALWKSQLTGGPAEVPDSPEVTAAREKAGFDGLTELAAALSRQLRYREAAEALTQALELRPDDASALRLRAGRRLSTLQCQGAAEDLARCLRLGADRLDVTYRRGLAEYFQGRWGGAAAFFESCMPLCGDEMGVAAIYWHTMCACRAGGRLTLLKSWRPGMEVGHHTAYNRAMAVFAGAVGPEALLAELAAEPSDLEYAIAMYGLCVYYEYEGISDPDPGALREGLLARDGFWPCYAWLAAWRDANPAQ